jgi:hypothetical protein
MKPILILTEPENAQAIAVAEALERKGGQPLLCFTSDFPSRAAESLRYEGGRRQIEVRGEGFSLSDAEIGVVWRSSPSYVLDPVHLHPADLRFADDQCRFFRGAFYELLAPSAFWVNRPAAAVLADYKMVQHETARRSGLNMPDTIYTNDPELIRAFIRRQGGKIVYKPIKPSVWKEDETIWMNPTSLLEESQLVSNEVLRLTPGIYQALVPKKHELRITIMGRRIFAAKILSQQTEDGRLDWRKAYDEIQMEPCDLPAPIADGCLELMRSLGIVFGCFDFVVTPAGDYLFLEVNEMGQFLFVEQHSGLPLLDAFCEFLLQARPDFDWAESRVAVRFESIAELATKRSERLTQLHVAALDR